MFICNTFKSQEVKHGVVISRCTFAGEATATGTRGSVSSASALVATAKSGGLMSSFLLMPPAFLPRPRPSVLR